MLVFDVRKSCWGIKNLRDTRCQHNPQTGVVAGNVGELEGASMGWEFVHLESNGLDKPTSSNRRHSLSLVVWADQKETCMKRSVCLAMQWLILIVNKIFTLDLNLWCGTTK